MTSNTAGEGRSGVGWDAESATFDDEPDHGLRDPAVRGAWAAGLRGRLPRGPADVLDPGCGAGGGSCAPAGGPSSWRASGGRRARPGCPPAG